jgi:hypothetical protein
MRMRLPLTVVLCVAVVLSFAVPAVAQGPTVEGDLSAQAYWGQTAGGQPWQRGRIAADDVNDFGGFPSIAVNPANGDTWAAYWDDSSDDLMVAHYVASGGNCGTGGTWSCTRVDAGGIVGGYTSIAIDPVTGEPGVTYHDFTNQQLKYAHVACGVFCIWLTQVVDAADSDDGIYTSLTYGSDGRAHIAYGADFLGVTPVKYAHEVDSGGNCGLDAVAGKWQCDYIRLSGDETDVSIALDAANEPRIAYRDNSGGDLYYAYRVGAGGNCGPSGNTWQCIAVDTGGANDVGGQASLRYVNGVAHLAYFDRTAGALKYATWLGGGTGNCGPANDWKCQVIDDGLGTSSRVSLAIEHSGTTDFPVIAYYDSVDGLPPHGVLKVARRVLFGNCGDSAAWFGHIWQCDVLDNGFSTPEGLGYAAPHDVGLGLSVATSSAGLATIAYYDADGGDLLVAYQRFAGYLPLQLNELPHP